MTEIEIGKEYRLLPDARHSQMASDSTVHLIKAGATRVRNLSGPDGDGDFRVEALDGSLAGDWVYVAPEYLAPLDEPAHACVPLTAFAAAPDKLMLADTTAPDTRSAAEVIAKALDRAFVEEPAVWVHASVDLAPDGTWGVIVTLDPDVGYDTEYRLTLKEV